MVYANPLANLFENRSVVQPTQGTLTLKSKQQAGAGTSCKGHYADTDFRFSRNLNRLHRASYSHRGACARHERGAGCGGRGSARDERGLLRRAKSCGSDAPIVGVKSVRRSADDGVKKRGQRGEREVGRKTIARGMPGWSGVTVVTNSYAFL